MSDKTNDATKRIEEMLRELMQQAEEGDGHPIFIGMKIIVPPGSFPGIPPAGGPGSRGNSTEPVIEVHRLGSHVTLVTELPGMSAENVQVLFRDNRVFIWAKDQERQYRTSAEVPPADKKTVEISFRHGVLEVSYRIAAKEQENPSSEG
jgi:HSP20 family molecular chaperone IbpA